MPRTLFRRRIWKIICHPPNILNHCSPPLPNRCHSSTKTLAVPPTPSFSIISTSIVAHHHTLSPHLPSYTLPMLLLPLSPIESTLTSQTCCSNWANQPWQAIVPHIIVAFIVDHHHRYTSIANHLY
ncbi:hypothetical protein ERO13_D05G320640v2 [Gossypium hirsutum]|nr:hypothetical protein ERO13_D05G320640v2 [Gossypium hirsutum]